MSNDDFELTSDYKDSEVKQFISDFKRDGGIKYFNEICNFKDDKRRFLCDLFGLQYTVSDEVLLNTIKEEVL